MTKRLLLSLIQIYRKGVSPYTPPCCRYIPTCSQYAIQAIEKHGAARGLWMAIKRIVRCNPLHRGGYDPVP
jgi:putative membrane protein insertion efficiency factor